MNRFSRNDFRLLVSTLEAFAAEYGSQGEAALINRTIGAFKAFLAEEVGSLDHAFGLVEGRGRRTAPEKFELACEAYHLKYRDGQSRTWEQVEEQLDAINSFELDGPGLKALVNRHKAEIQLHFFKQEIEAAFKDD